MRIVRMTRPPAWRMPCSASGSTMTMTLETSVNWPIALVMALGSSAGGYAMSGLAQRVPQAWVRHAVTVIGLGSAIWLFAKEYV